MGNLRDRLRPPPGILCQTSCHPFFPRRWNRLRFNLKFFSSLCQRWWNFLPNLVIDITDIKRRLAGEQLVNARAKRIDIVEMSAPLALELLRTHVRECAASAARHRYHAHRIAQAAGNPKVGHFELATLIHHQISRLEIAMDDVRVVVRVVERIAELAHPIGQFGSLKDLSLLIAAQMGKRVAIDVFHRNAARAFVVHEVVNADDVFVGEFQATSRLALEIAQHGSIVNDQVR